MEKKKVLIRKEQMPDFYQVGEDGLVSPNDSTITPVLDMSDYTKPLEDGDAINWDLPFNQVNAVKEIYDLLGTDQARRQAADIKLSIRMLANPVEDTADYLRMKHQALYSILITGDNWRTVISTSRRRLATQLADLIFSPSPFDEGPTYTSWTEFIGANLEWIQAYSQAYNDWLLMRWLQRLIYYTEQHSLHKVLAMTQVQPVAIERPKVEETPAISLRQIALLHIFQGRLLTKNNADQKAREYGHTSGEKLMKFYRTFYERVDRIRLEGAQPIRAMIKDLTAILGQLTEEQRAAVADEINTLRRKI